jgi:HPt (histidine-containing phosphotransfer) domain-containing protein
MDDDPVFRAELLSTFYHEGLGHLVRMHGACASFHSGDADHTFDGPAGPITRPIEQVIKDEAHAIKGSAATLELESAAAAAAGVEDPAKQIVACAGALSVEDRAMLLRAFCLEPATELKALVKEVREAAVYFLSWMKQKTDEEGLDLASEMDPAEGERLALVSLAYFDEKVLYPFAELWKVDSGKLAAGEA